MKKFLLFLFIVLIVAAAGLFYLGRGLGYLPDWFTAGEFSPVEQVLEESGDAQPALAAAESTAAEADGKHPSAELPEASQEKEQPQKNAPAGSAPAGGSPRPAPKKISLGELHSGRTVQRITRELEANGRVKVSAAELDQMILGSIEQNFPGQTDKMVKALKSEIHDGAISVETVLNLKKVPWEVLPQQARLAKNLIMQFNGPADSLLYLHLSGSPSYDGRQLVFDDKASLQVGKIQYPLKSLVTNFSLEDRLKLPSLIGSLRFKYVSVEDDMLVLSKNPPQK